MDPFKFKRKIKYSVANIRQHTNNHILGNRLFGANQNHESITNVRTWFEVVLEQLRQHRPATPSRSHYPNGRPAAAVPQLPRETRD
jgi:acyl-CoA thioesterase